MSVEKLKKLADHLFVLDSGSGDARLLFWAVDEIKALRAQIGHELMLALNAPASGPGCICPPGANKDCWSVICPRKTLESIT
jgi:hypothetical protein